MLTEISRAIVVSRGPLRIHKSTFCVAVVTKITNVHETRYKPRRSWKIRPLASATKSE